MWLLLTLQRLQFNMSVRRSVRNAGKVINYSYEPLSLFPEGPPSNTLEHHIHSLNLVAFESAHYARVDDIIVAALFATKRCPQYYRALLPDTAGNDGGISPEQGISMAKIIQSTISGTCPTKDECDVAAMKLCSMDHPTLTAEDLKIVEQYAVQLFNICK